MNKSFYPFLFIVLTIFIAQAIPDLFADGMFMDGLMYASVAKNLSQGEGSFWFLHFSDTVFPVFHEHPPLVFGIQSLFYTIFGDSILVEKLFSFATYFISGFLLFLIWQEITGKKLSDVSWLPLLFWVLLPLVHWAAVNNILENTMLIFVCLSVLFTIKSLKHKKYFYLTVSGLMLFGAFMSKGFTGLFPLSLPFWICCFTGRHLKFFVIDTSVLLVGLFLPLLFIYLFNEEGIASLKAYLDIQVFKSIEEVKTVNSRFYILGKLFTELLIPLGLVIVVLIFGKRESSKNEERPWIFIFFALGLSGVLPILISMKQSGFYIICALPFFAMALALIISSHVKNWVNKIDLTGKRFKVFRVLGIVLLVSSIALALMQKGKSHQHQVLIHDVREMAKVLPPHSVISVPDDFSQHWSMYAYFQRYAGISLEAGNTYKREYLLLSKNAPFPSDYQWIDLPTSDFNLLRRK